MGNEKAFGEWLKRAYDYAASLPAKVPKAGK
jgi:hypothetical protein